MTEFMEAISASIVTSAPVLPVSCRTLWRRLAELEEAEQAIKQALSGRVILAAVMMG